jgi:hypothetical protein
VSRQRTAYLSPKLEARLHPEKGGYGVYAYQPVQAGELLAVWGGDVITRLELALLTPTALRHTIQIEEDLYLAPTRAPEPADYVNHSCDPNAGLSGQIALIALRPIAPDEEICFDYATCDGSIYDEFECACNSPHCRGQVTANDWARPELWKRYAGHFSPYLQRRIDRLQAQIRLSARRRKSRQAAAFASAD